MKAIVNGVAVEGTAEELKEYVRLNDSMCGCAHEQPAAQEEMSADETDAYINKLEEQENAEAIEEQPVNDYATLTWKDKEMIVLMLQHCLTIKEIQKVLGKRNDVVTKEVAKAREQLQSKFNDMLARIDALPQVDESPAPGERENAIEMGVKRAHKHRKNLKWTAARDDKLRALVKKGLTYPQVAKKMGCTEGQIIGHVSYLKVKGKPVNR